MHAHGRAHNGLIHGVADGQEGDPQTCRRAVLIARRHGTAVLLPEATHQQFRKGISNVPRGLPLLPWVTMGEA